MPDPRYHEDRANDTARRPGYVGTAMPVVPDLQGSGSSYIYRHGTPVSPHELWSGEQQRSFSLGQFGVRSGVDLSFGREEKVHTDAVGLSTTRPSAGYH